MAHQPAAAAVAYDVNGHGLRFLNEDWNDSISNGNLFTLTWNQSLVKAGAELGLFKVTYPADGVVVREKREKEDATPHQDVTRNGSVDSAITVQTVTESEDGIKSKPSLWLITRPPEEQHTTTSEILEDQDRIVEPVSRGDRSIVQSPV
ncbi:hypothetical protein E5D57_007285 [Metarhizium anisopliae]|nr:hypothetical protein E5D57_007285 [Metarhizium anisopliae]